MGELPSGTVTFLFTDIEGSTRLLKQLGRAVYGEVMADQQRLMREAFAHHSGEEIDTQGDSFFAAFRSASDAVAAAVEIQRLLAGNSWPHGADVRVRIGIHTGEAAATSERYLGLAVHRGARIAAAAHGGQVLLSNTTRELVEDDLPLDVGLEDLGEHRLKDLDRPERLFQLVIEGLPSEFPPLRTLEAESAFAGREAELAEEAAVAIAGRRWYRRPVVIGTLAGVIAAAVAVPLFALGGSSGRIEAHAAVPPNSVVAIDPATGKVIDHVPVGTSPAAITAGAGALWVADVNDNTVTRINPSTRKVVRAISIEGRPTSLAASTGAVWVAIGNAEKGRVYRIDPQYNRVIGVVHVVANPYAFFGNRAVSATKNQVWVANTNATALRIDPKVNHAAAKVDTGGGQQPSIAIGLGSIWVGTDTDNAVRRFARNGALITRIPVGAGPSNLAVGAGAVWVANRLDDTVTRIDPTSNAGVSTIPVGGHPLGIAVARGAVWVANSRSGTIWKIDPATNRVVKRVPLGNSPTGITVADGLLWVTVAPDPFAPSEGTSQGGVARFDVVQPDFYGLDPALSGGFEVWQLPAGDLREALQLPG